MAVAGVEEDCLLCKDHGVLLLWVEVDLCSCNFGIKGCITGLLEELGLLLGRGVDVRQRGGDNGGQDRRCGRGILLLLLLGCVLICELEFSHLGDLSASTRAASSASAFAAAASRSLSLCWLLLARVDILGELMVG